MPRKGVPHTDIDPEMAELQRLMNLTGIQHTQLVDDKGLSKVTVWNCFNTPTGQKLVAKQAVREKVLVISKERIRAAAKLHDKLIQSTETSNGPI